MSLDSSDAAAAGAPAALAMPQGLSRTMKAEAKPGARLAPILPAAGKAAPAPAQPMAASMEFGLSMGFGLLDAMTVDSGEHYLSGRALIQIEGQPGPNPAAGALIFATGIGGPSPKRAGQMLGRTDTHGHYYFASSLCNELIRGGARLLGVEPDFGTTSTSVGVVAAGGGAGGTLLRAYDMYFNVAASQLGDHVAPYAELGFEVKDASGAFRAVEIAKPGDRLYAVVKAHDDKTPELELNLDLSVDERRHPACSAGCGAHPEWSRLEALDHTDRRGLTTYRFPLDVPPAGSHAVHLIATDQACNRSELSRELMVFAFGDEPADQPGQAPTATLRVDPDASATRTDSAVGLIFSEPVSGISTASLFLEFQENGGWTRETVRLYGPKGEAAPSDRIGQLYFRLSGRLRAGTSYRVRWTGALQDSEGKALEGAFPTFKTVGYLAYPPQRVEGKTLGELAALGNRTFVVEKDQATGRFRIGEWYVQDGSWTFLGSFGPSAAGDFYTQGVCTIGAFEAVPLSADSAQHLLLVTTTPDIGDWDHQAVLWGFSVCAVGNPQLVFAVSLGPGAGGYTPSLDCRDGIIAAGRLCSSVLLIDVQKAASGWSALSADQQSLVRLPGGANQQAILQPFWLANPESKDLHMTLFPGTHKMVGLVPGAGGATPAFNVAVGYTQLDENALSPLSGLATSVLPMNLDANGFYMPQPPYLGPEGYGAPDVRAHAADGLNPALGLYPFQVIPNVTVTEGDQTRQTTLVVGVHADQRRIKVVDVGDPTAPKLLSEWLAPEGMTLIRSRSSFSYDAATNWIALRMQQNGQTLWGVMDVSDPLKPRLVGQLFEEASGGVMSEGCLYLQNSEGLKAVDFAVVEEEALPATPTVRSALSPSRSIDLERLNLTMPADPQSPCLKRVLIPGKIGIVAGNHVVKSNTVNGKEIEDIFKYQYTQMMKIVTQTGGKNFNAPDGVSYQTRIAKTAMDQASTAFMPEKKKKVVLGIFGHSKDYSTDNAEMIIDGKFENVNTGYKRLWGYYSDETWPKNLSFKLPDGRDYSMDVPIEKTSLLPQTIYADLVVLGLCHGYQVADYVNLRVISPSTQAPGLLVVSDGIIDVPVAMSAFLTMISYGGTDLKERAKTFISTYEFHRKNEMDLKECDGSFTLYQGSIGGTP